MKGWNWFPLRLLGCIGLGILVGYWLGFGWGLLTYFLMFMVEVSKAETEHDEQQQKEREEDYYV